jgi:hypothetical protein
MVMTSDRSNIVYALAQPSVMTVAGACFRRVPLTGSSRASAPADQVDDKNHQC